MNKKKLDSIYCMIGGILFIGIGFLLKFLITELEENRISQISANKIVQILYRQFGGNGTFTIFVGLGIIFFIFGLVKYKKCKTIQ